MFDTDSFYAAYSFDATTGEFYRKVKKGNRNVGDIAGNITSNGYRVIYLKGKLHLAHRMAWYLYYNETSNGLIDHIDGNKLNNSMQNLRVITKSGNAQNTAKCRPTNKLGFLGVSKHGKRYRAEITLNYKSINLGCYDTPELAYAAYLSKKSEIHSYANMDRLLNNTQN